MRMSPFCNIRIPIVARCNLHPVRSSAPAWPVAASGVTSVMKTGAYS